MRTYEYKSLQMLWCMQWDPVAWFSTNAPHFQK
jgi:hypothetical protein